MFVETVCFPTRPPLDVVARRAVFSNAQVIKDLVPATWRADMFGSQMRWTDYGDSTSPTGWDVVYLKNPGPDHITNMVAVNFANIDLIQKRFEQSE